MMKILLLLFTFIGPSMLLASPSFFPLSRKSSDFLILDQAIVLGERLSDWMELVNSKRNKGSELRLTSSSSRDPGNPIETPTIISIKIIDEATKEIMKSLPAKMKRVLKSSGSLGALLPIDDITFIKHARKINYLYQMATRYKLLISYRGYYIDAAKRDVRGYYYLTKNKIESQDLRDSRTIASSNVKPLKEALLRICINANKTVETCKMLVDDSFQNNTLSTFYEAYFPSAKKNWDSFFEIDPKYKRKDVIWMDNTLMVPFLAPSQAKFVSYLQNNIQDEWRWNNWSLVLNFTQEQESPHLRFEPGMLPHVNGLGSSEIIMDENQSIDEFDAQWTIRHEFGHILGLPDCYLEFYDKSADAFISYELDTTDLMCSRAGNMNKRIYRELKKAYSP